MIVQGFYGLKSEGAYFNKYLAKIIHNKGFKPNLTDQYKLMNPSVKPCGYNYYTYVNTWVFTV